MKFDHLLRIYWSRYFLYGGVTFPFSMSLFLLWRALRGVGFKALHQIEKRFECGPLRLWWKVAFVSPLLTSKRQTLNIYFAKLLNINGGVREGEYVNLMRLYMIKSYRGRALALGKPARGQRTWSNARTAKLTKNTFKSFVSLMQGERIKQAALLAKKVTFFRGKARPQRRRIRRRSNRQKKLQIRFDAQMLWF